MRVRHTDSLKREIYSRWGLSIIGLMKVKVILHEAEEGGYWAKVLDIPGSATQGETIAELIHNLYEAMEGCILSQFDTV
jgi:predicted RNase H-like HicB family nuclease